MTKDVDELLDRFDDWLREQALGELGPARAMIKGLIMLADGAPVAPQHVAEAVALTRELGAAPEVLATIERLGRLYTQFQDRTGAATSVRAAASAAAPQHFTATDVDQLLAEYCAASGKLAVPPTAPPGSSSADPTAPPGSSSADPTAPEPDSSADPMALAEAASQLDSSLLQHELPPLADEAESAPEAAPEDADGDEPTPTASAPVDEEPAPAADLPIDALFSDRAAAQDGAPSARAPLVSLDDWDPDAQAPARTTERARAAPEPTASAPTEQSTDDDRVVDTAPPPADREQSAPPAPVTSGAAGPRRLLMLAAAGALLVGIAATSILLTDDDDTPPRRPRPRATVKADAKATISRRLGVGDLRGWLPAGWRRHSAAPPASPAPAAAALATGLFYRGADAEHPAHGLFLGRSALPERLAGEAAHTDQRLADLASRIEAALAARVGDLQPYQHKRCTVAKLGGRRTGICTGFIGAEPHRAALRTYVRLDAGRAVFALSYANAKLGEARQEADLIVGSLH